MSRILTASFFFLLSSLPAIAGQLTGTASVIEGDRLEIHGQVIRLHGIDAPESEQICRVGGEPWQCGRDAASALAERIGGRIVTCWERRRDRYGQVLAACSMEGEDLGEWMLLNGWAVAYHLHSYEYSRAETIAKENERGIWASNFEMPWDWRKRQRPTK